MDLKSGLVGAPGRAEGKTSEKQARAGRDPRYEPDTGNLELIGEAAG